MAGYAEGVVSLRVDGDFAVTVYQSAEWADRYTALDLEHYGHREVGRRELSTGEVEVRSRLNLSGAR